MFYFRLMVNLTQPVDLCFPKPETKGDKVYQSYALEILSHQQSYKEAFGDEEFMACLASRLKRLLEKVFCFSNLPFFFLGETSDRTNSVHKGKW